MSLYPPSVVISSALFLTACSQEEPTFQDGPGDTAPPVDVEVVPAASSWLTTGFFLDGPVSGVNFEVAGRKGITSATGRYGYVPGQPIVFSVGSLRLGEASGQPFVSPLDLFPGLDAESGPVLDVARFLQSLDQDGLPDNGITISPKTRWAVDRALEERGPIDWTNSADVSDLIGRVVRSTYDLRDHALVEVSREQAQAHLVRTLWANGLYRTRLARSATVPSDKVRLDTLGVLARSRDADGVEVDAPGDGWVAPLVANWLEEVPGTGASDVNLAISLDEGRSWWSMNLSQTARRSSFKLRDGSDAPGASGKPVVKVAGDRFVVTWTDTYCPDVLPGGVTEADDVFGAAGPQGSVDYTAQGRPDLGEVPFACVWAARGRVDGDGRITVLTPEPLSSGTRDATEQVVYAVKDVGFVVAWQEDPLGLRLGEAEGPGDGLSGATVNPGTDIWMSSIGWTDAIAALGFDDGRAQRVVPPVASFGVPVRVSDNAACEVSNGQVLVGGPYCLDVCVEEGDGTGCVTADGDVLDGEAGASRATMFATPKTITNPDGSTTKTAQVVLAYEESRGGSSEGEAHLKAALKESDGDAQGKVVIYHAFDLLEPDQVSPGTVVSDPALSARRARIVGQSPSQVGPADTRLVLLYREGAAGQAAPADIRMRRATGGVRASDLGAPVNLSSPVLEDRPLRPGTPAWKWTKDALASDPEDNPFDNARAHRATLRGDVVLVAWVWTPDDDAASRGEGTYDLFLRRSFDGGQSWTNAAGAYEAPLNVTTLTDTSTMVIEPRLVGTPSSLAFADGSASPDPDDAQNANVVFLAWGTSTNLGYDVENVALDLLWSRSTDAGETWSQGVELDPVTGEPVGVHALLAGGAEEQGESQLRSNPAGTVLFASWNQSSTSAASPQNDPWFRRISFRDPVE